MTEAVVEQIDSLVNNTRQNANNIYNQGVMDGISLIYNMLNDHDDLTIETVKETCKIFLKKYSTEGMDLPDVPNMSDELVVPKEASDMGMSTEDYTDLVNFMNDIPPVDDSVDNPDMTSTIIDSDVTEIDEQPDDNVEK